VADSYEIVTYDRTVRERVHSYTAEDALAPGSVVLIEGRYWLVDRLLDQCGVNTRRDPQETWLDTVKRRLGHDLDSFRPA
jgi:hypothetical protein